MNGAFNQIESIFAASYIRVHKIIVSKPRSSGLWMFIGKTLSETKCTEELRRYFCSSYHSRESHPGVKIKVPWQGGFTLDLKGGIDKLQVGWGRARIVLQSEEVSASWTGNVYLCVWLVLEGQTILILITGETKNGKWEGCLCSVLSQVNKRVICEFVVVTTTSVQGVLSKLHGEEWFFWVSHF